MHPSLQLARAGAYALRFRPGRTIQELNPFAINLVTTHQPLAQFVQVLALHAWHSAVQLDVSHIGGCHNHTADLLSRWDGLSALPAEFSSEYRFRCTLPVLWDRESDVRIFPRACALAVAAACGHCKVLNWVLLCYPWYFLGFL